MPTVDLVTYCCPKDIVRAYAGFDTLVQSHQYDFHETIMIRQRCRGWNAGVLDSSIRIVDTEDYPDIYGEFGIDVDAPEVRAVEAVGNRYYWKYHCMNQLIGLKVSTAEYVAFTDCDNVLEGDEKDSSWVDRGVSVLQENKEVLVVCPNQWKQQDGDARVQAMSTCMFLCERQRFLELDYNAPLPANVALNNFHLQFEGRLWRYGLNRGVCRVMLGYPPYMMHLAWL